MDSSNELDLKKVNQEIVAAFEKKAAIDANSAIFIEELNLKYPLKLQYYLIEEFVRNDFMEVVEDGKVFFKQKKYNFEKKKVQWTYIGIWLIPFVVGGLLLLL